MASILDRILGGIGDIAPATQQQARDIISAVKIQAKEIERLMAKLTDVQAAIEAVKAGVTKEVGEVVAKMQALKDQIVAGTIKESDLDAVVADLNNLVAAIDKISEDSSAPNPEPPTP